MKIEIMRTRNMWHVWEDRRQGMRAGGGKRVNGSFIQIQNKA